MSKVASYRKPTRGVSKRAIKLKLHRNKVSDQIRSSNSALSISEPEVQRTKPPVDINSLNQKVDALENYVLNTEMKIKVQTVSVTELENAKEIYAAYEIKDHYVEQTEIIALHKSKVSRQTPILPPKTRKPGRWKTLPYMADFGSRSGSSSRMPKIIGIKHPFVSDTIYGPHNEKLYSRFLDWVHEGTLKRHAFKSARHNSSVAHEMRKLSKLIPTYSENSNVYKDCGVYVTAYAEYISHGKGVPPRSFDVEALRTRSTALLWNQGTQKIEENAMSNDESPDRPMRP
ncbi:hypothetical protein FXO38_04699 [Capsicum annuum]|nr:hypothetical protein FXO37_25750 [Capsicum annuum]KAF3675562.1 hypothetical protein FXO38_04699 [Capsicum annuum]